ncbi:hypothetical protein CGLO_18265 [Colletotrichum gloeosporioides Cg-14]|nr:hypothetical protein CGLO_18265 [Colletotrichum gloeosporioides Cg-14]
MEQNHN